MKTAIQLFRIRKRNLLLLKKIFDVKRLTKISYWSGIISVKENFPKLQKHYQFTERRGKKTHQGQSQISLPPFVLRVLKYSQLLGRKAHLWVFRLSGCFNFSINWIAQPSVISKTSIHRWWIKSSKEIASTLIDLQMSEPLFQSEFSLIQILWDYKNLDFICLIK